MFVIFKKKKKKKVTPKPKSARFCGGTPGSNGAGAVAQ